MKNIGLGFCLMTALFLTACSKENGEAKVETSVKIDVDDHKAALEKNMKKAGNDIKAGAEEVKEKLADAGEAIKETYNDAKDKLTDDKKAEVEVKVKKD